MLRELTPGQARRAVEAGKDVWSESTKAGRSLAKEISQSVGGKGASRLETHGGGQSHRHVLDAKGRHLDGAGHIFGGKLLEALLGILDFTGNGVVDAADVGEAFNPWPTPLMCDGPVI